MPHEITAEIEDKLTHLRAMLRAMGRVVVAFSGGVDSTFLLKIAYDELGENAQGIIGVSPSVAVEEMADARLMASLIGVTLREVPTFQMNDENYASNPINRCYFCKTEIYQVLNAIAADAGDAIVCDGTNTDDVQEWRPGARAGEEQRIRSPLCEANLNKKEIRILSRRCGLPTWDKPASPCLSSRIPYGTPVTLEALSMIGEAESWIHQQGIREVRVRHYREGEFKVAHIEVPPHDLAALFILRDELVAKLKNLGYRKVLLDLEGYRRGKLNDQIAPDLVQIESHSGRKSTFVE